MASEHALDALHVPPDDHDALLTRAPPLDAPARTIEEENPFRSRGGSPRLYAPQSNTTNDYVPRPATNSTVYTSPISMEKRNGDSPYNSAQELNRNSVNLGFGGNPFLPPPSAHLSQALSMLQRRNTRDTRRSGIERNSSSTESKQATLATRLAPTIKHAEDARDQYAKKAKLHGYALNTAIGLQVLLGSLTTGLSAAATTGRSAAVQTTILGGLSTIVASYMARARGSNEPELSISRVKDLDQFIRECKALSMDHGYDTTGHFDDELKAKRKRFEELLGNASGERKMSSPV